MATNLTDAEKYGSVGGNVTLQRHGTKHFTKAANIRWKAWRLANKKKHGTKKK